MAFNVELFALELKKAKEGTPTTRTAKPIVAQKRIPEEHKLSLIQKAMDEAKAKFDAANQPLPDNVRDQYNALWSAAFPNIVHNMLREGYSENDIRSHLGYVSTKNDKWKRMFDPGLELFKRTIASEVANINPKSETVVINGRSVDMREVVLEAVTTAVFQSDPTKPIPLKLRGKGNSHYPATDILKVNAEGLKTIRANAQKRLATAQLRTRGQKQQVETNASEAALLMIQKAMGTTPTE